MHLKKILLIVGGLWIGVAVFRAWQLSQSSTGLGSFAAYIGKTLANPLYTDA